MKKDAVKKDDAPKNIAETVRRKTEKRDARIAKTEALLSTRAQRTLVSVSMCLPANASINVSTRLENVVFTLPTRPDGKTGELAVFTQRLDAQRAKEAATRGEQHPDRRFPWSHNITVSVMELKLPIAEADIDALDAFVRSKAYPTEEPAPAEEPAPIVEAAPVATKRARKARTVTP